MKGLLSWRGMPSTYVRQLRWRCLKRENLKRNRNSTVLEIRFSGSRETSRPSREHANYSRAGRESGRDLKQINDVPLSRRFKGILCVAGIVLDARRPKQRRRHGLGRILASFVGLTPMASRRVVAFVLETGNLTGISPVGSPAFARAPLQCCDVDVQSSGQQSHPRCHLQRETMDRAHLDGGQ